MKKNICYVVLTAFLSVLFYLVFSGFANNYAEFKMGYVISAKILDEYPEAVAVKKKIETLRGDYQKQLDAKIALHDTKVQELNRQTLLITEATKTAKLTEIQKLEDEIMQFRSKWEDQESGEIITQWNTSIKPVVDKVQAVIDKIGKDEGYDIIFDAKEGNILYVKDTYDLTPKILVALSKK
jgi:Skp family chaperone for outer membrane proteins